MKYSLQFFIFFFMFFLYKLSRWLSAIQFNSVHFFCKESSYANSTMVALYNPAIEQFPFTKTSCNTSTLFPAIPLIDLSKPDAKALMIKACEDFGFFKVINHGVPLEFISRLEAEAVKFFSLPLSEKEQAGPPCPFGYGNKSIGPNGDLGRVEYLLFTANQDSNLQRFVYPLGKNPEKFRYKPAEKSFLFYFRLHSCVS